MFKMNEIYSNVNEFEAINQLSLKIEIALFLLIALFSNFLIQIHWCFFERSHRYVKLWLCKIVIYWRKKNLHILHTYKWLLKYTQPTVNTLEMEFRWSIEKDNLLKIIFLKINFNVFDVLFYSNQFIQFFLHCFVYIEPSCDRRILFQK